MIDTRILRVSDAFIKEVGLDANSLKESSVWSKYRISDSNGYNRYIINQLSADLLLKAADAHTDCTTVSSPRVLAMSSKQATIEVIKTEWYMMTQTNELENIKAGTVINFMPTMEEENKIKLDFDIKITEINEPVSQKSASRKNQNVLPEIVTIFSESSDTVIPDGNSLLIVGQKVTQTFSKEAKPPILGDLPFISRLFRNRSYITDYYIPLMLIKTTILTEEQRSQIDYIKPDVNNTIN